VNLEGYCTGFTNFVVLLWDAKIKLEKDFLSSYSLDKNRIRTTTREEKTFVVVHCSKSRFSSVLKRKIM
jgi:hypothetical protein